jgi:hypothetical protein
MREIGIPDADYITFGDFGGDEERKDIPHYNLITMNGHCGISPTNRLSVFIHLAENVEDDIREILEYHINHTDLPEEKSANMINDKIKNYGGMNMKAF